MWESILEWVTTTNVLIGAALLLAGMFFWRKKIVALFKKGWGWVKEKIKPSPATAVTAMVPAVGNTTADAEKNIERPINVYPSVYWASLVALLAIGFVVGLPFTYFDTFELGGVKWNTGYIIWTLEPWLLIPLITIVDPQKRAGILVLGIPTITATSGMVLVIPGIHKLHEVSRETYQMELPQEPEKIFRKEDVETVPDGMVPPIRITFANADPNDTNIDKTDPLHIRTTNEVSVFARWRIIHFWDFYVRVQTADEARKQLSDMCVAVLQEALTRKTVGQALAELSTISGLLDDAVRAQTAKWGIEIVDVRIKLIGLTHRLNESLQKIALNTANKKATIIEAEAEREKKTLEGTGTANAIRAEIDARTGGMEEMAKKLAVHGKDVLGAETAREIGKGASTKLIVGAPGIRELAGIGSALAESMNDNKKGTTP